MREDTSTKLGCRSMRKTVMRIGHPLDRIKIGSNHTTVRSERSPLHDVRQHVHCGRLMEETRAQTRIQVFFRTRGREQVIEITAGGARRDRTDDLLLAKQALSQLSYGPALAVTPAPLAGMVGLGRLELPTSRLSSARSNQLSYRPNYQQSAHA